MDRFSVRMGFVGADKAIQVNSMDEELRTGLWNLVNKEVLSTYYFENQARKVIELLYEHFYKKPVDEAPYGSSYIRPVIRKLFFTSPWYHPYDLIEFMLQYPQTFVGISEVIRKVNSVLEREKSGYRFSQGRFVAITSESELDAIQDASNNDSFKGAAEHIRCALNLYADRKSPNYRNSVKESISAVESVALNLTGKDDLASALAELERKHSLHSVLKQGFIKLYGYTNDGTGIRHAILDDNQEVSEADARYMLVTCSAFVNYLISRYGG